MKELAEDVYQLSQPLVNQYIVDDVLVDAGLSYYSNNLLAKLKGQRLNSHVITHAHPDHLGASRVICNSFKIPMLCGVGDKQAAERGNFALTVLGRPLRLPTGKLGIKLIAPQCKVAKTLKEGDRVGSFTVLETPGHTEGHISLWRENDRTLLLGDVLMNLALPGSGARLSKPFSIGTANSQLNVHSAKRLAKLKPNLVCFGHGPPLRDPWLFEDFVNGL